MLTNMFRIAFCILVYFSDRLVATDPLYNGIGDSSEHHIIVRKQSSRLQSYIERQYEENEFESAIYIKYGLEIIQSFQIGSWRAALVKGTLEQIRPLGSDQQVAYTEADCKVKSFLGFDPGLKYTFRDLMNNSSRYVDEERVVVNENHDSSLCYHQVPGRMLWHLPRVSSHERPDYTNSPYEFTEFDQGQGVDVYVVDSGVRTSHEQIEGRARFGFKATYLNEPSGDMAGHGTNVASLAAGTSVGVAKLARVISVKVLNGMGEGALSWILEGLDWITKRISDQRSSDENPRCVINLSLGTEGISRILDEAVTALSLETKCSVVVAAGNGNTNACSTSPARLTSVLTVGATTNRDTLASFSNYGPCVDILAPGESVVGAWSTSDDMYALVSGTSQATPLVTGVVARFLSSLQEDSIPSSSFIKKYIADVASYGYISMLSADARNTTNALLYRACEALGPEPSPDSLLAPSTQSGSPTNFQCMQFPVLLSCTAFITVNYFIVFQSD